MECLQVANTVGWQNVREVDAVSGIEAWPHTLEMAKDKNRPRNVLEIDDLGWRYNTDDQVFYGPADSGLK